MSMENDPVSVKNAERLTKLSGRQTEAIFYVKTYNQNIHAEMTIPAPRMRNKRVLCQKRSVIAWGAFRRHNFPG